MKRLLFILLLFGVMTFQVNAQKDTTKHRREYNIPIVTLSETELDEEEGQDISGLLQASKDIFVSTAGFTFGAARFKIRGYESENTSVMINGIGMNDPETGRAYWSVWGGLNDVTRDKEVEIGIVGNPYGASNLGGYTNIIARASKYRKGTKLVYSNGNRSYRNRAMITHSTGMMSNGFALTASVSRRWANEGYVEGSFYDAYSYFLSLEKKFSEKHSLNLVIFNAPKKAGSAGFSTQEAYDLAGSNYYNPNWGWQNGKKRNARVSNYNQPKLLLTDYFTINEKTKLTTSFMYSMGKGARSRLSWYKADDPRPDYYRHLPYYVEEGYTDNDSYYGNAHFNRWEISEGQIQWDQFYSTNSRFLYTIENKDGSGEDFEGNLANYMMEEEHNDHQQLVLQTNITHNFNEHIELNAGLISNYYVGSHYKTVQDLLGADFWVDYDKFAERMSDGVEKRDNDIRIPNHMIKEGDVFGYNYQSIIQKNTVYAKANFNYSKVDFHLSGDFTFNSLYRNGEMQNGKFPDRSLGKSETQHLIDYSLFGGVTYKITGRHFITANAAFLSRSPKFKQLYTSARTRDDIIDYDGNELIQSFDVNYIVRYPKFKSRITYYHTNFKNSIYQTYLYMDNTHSFVNYIMTDVQKVHTGIEAAAEYEVISGWTVYGVLAKGLNLYQNQPTVTAYVDNDNNNILDSETEYIEGYHSGRGPETVASVGIKYWSSTYWFGGISANYIDGVYRGLSMPKYLERNDFRADDNTPYYDYIKDEILGQEKMDPGYTVNIFAGKSWKIKYKYYINVSLNVSNVLDNQDVVIGSFDQFRFQADSPFKFKPKYFYLYGRQYFLNVSFRF